MSLVRVVRMAMMGQAKSLHPLEERFAAYYTDLVETRSLALRHVQTLSKPAARPMWEWAREFHLAAYREYRTALPKLRELADINRFFDDDSDWNSVINESCLSLLTIFGMALAELLGQSHHRLPMRLPRLDPTLARLFK
jgi:hypothetical protein